MYSNETNNRLNNAKTRRDGILVWSASASYFGTYVLVYGVKYGMQIGTKDTCGGILFKAIIVNSAHFSAGRNSRINRVTDHKQKRACGSAPIILDCIIASSNARIASRAILFPLCFNQVEHFQRGFGREIKPCLILFKVRFRLERAACFGPEPMRSATDRSYRATLLAQCVFVLIGLNSLLHTI